jgi:hypothetical protein
MLEYGVLEEAIEEMPEETDELESADDLRSMQ